MTAPLSLVSSWREAMDGVTPGPWIRETEAEDRVAESEEDRQPEVYVCSERTVCDATVVATMGRSETFSEKRKQADAAWIARCSPSGVSALLDVIEAQARALSEKEGECERLRKERDHWKYGHDASERQRDEALAALKCVKQQCETAVYNITQREHDEAVVRSFQSVADFCARSALENGPAALADATQKDPGTEQREAGRG